MNREPEAAVLWWKRRRKPMRLLSCVLLLLCLTGCGSRIFASVQGTAGERFPPGLSWSAVPGLAETDSDTLSGVNQVGLSIAPTLAANGWKQLAGTESGKADVLVLVWWRTKGPEHIVDPAASRRASRQTARLVRSLNRPSRYDPYPAAPTLINAVYSRELVLVALQAEALPPVLRRVLTGSPVPDTELSRAPYAAPLRLADEAPETGIPRAAILWQVAVKSGSAKDNTRTVLPQLAVLAAQGIGKNMQAELSVDESGAVAYSR